MDLTYDKEHEWGLLRQGEILIACLLGLKRRLPNIIANQAIVMKKLLDKMNERE